MYDIGSTEENVNAYMRDLPIRRMIRGDKYPLQISIKNQNAHIPGTKEFEDRVISLKDNNEFGPSRLTITIQEAQKLVNKYAGTGIIERSKKTGEWTKKELITIHPGDIGVVVDNRNGNEGVTSTFKIHYSERHGTHIVPDYPSKKGAKCRK